MDIKWVVSKNQKSLLGDMSDGKKVHVQVTPAGVRATLQDAGQSSSVALADIGISEITTSTFGGKFTRFSVTNVQGETHYVPPREKTTPIRADYLDIEEKSLSSGASSDVYVATLNASKFGLDPGQRVAVKVIKASFLENPEEQVRIRREFKIGQEIVHENLARIYDLIEDSTSDRQFGLVLEYVDGRRLSETIKSDTRPESVTAIRGIISVIKELHDRDILHRDIKPDNILIDRSGTLKVIDFGVSKFPGDKTITKGHEFLGTVRYSSPQALEGGDYAKSDDMYSVGAVLHELITGQQLFSDTQKNNVLLADRIRKQAPPLLAGGDGNYDSTPYRIRLLADRLLSKKAEDRPTAAEALDWVMTSTDNSYCAFLENFHSERSSLGRGARSVSLDNFLGSCERCGDAFIIGRSQLSEYGYSIMPVLSALAQRGSVNVRYSCSTCERMELWDGIGLVQQRHIKLELIEIPEEEDVPKESGEDKLPF